MQRRDSYIRMSLLLSSKTQNSVRGYEPRGQGFEFLQAVPQINGLNNRQTVRGHWQMNRTYRNILVRLVNEAPARVGCIRLAICCWLSQTYILANR